MIRDKKDKKKLINFFKINLDHSLIEEYIVSRNLNKFFKLFFKIKKYNIKNIILFFFAIFPGGQFLYKKFKKSW